MKPLLTATIILLGPLASRGAHAQIGAIPPPAPPAQAATQPALALDTANPASQVGPSYVIGPTDGLQVTVWKDATLSGPQSVRSDGMITLPLLGDIPAAGFTPMALSADLTNRLKKYMTDPLVTVTVSTVNSKHIFMLGELGHIGALPFTPGITPLQAIAMSGGLSTYAKATKIYILRVEGGKQKKIFFNYKKALKDGNEQGVVLMPGDTIVVP